MSIYKITKDSTKMLIIWAVISILISIILFLTGVSFSEPDDYLLSGIYSGCYGDGLKCVLVQYINVVYGCVAQVIGLFAEQAAWGIILLFLLAYASFNIHISFSSKESDVVGHTSAIIAQIFLGKYFLTYTVVAFFLSGSALLLLFHKTERTDKGDGFRNALSAIGFILGILLRIDVLLPILLLMLPVFLRLKEKRTAAIIVAVTIALFVFADYCLFDLNDGWDGYYHWNSERQNLVDYDISWKDIDIDDVLRKIDWDYNDIEMLTHWRFADKNVFSAENLETVISSVPLGEKYSINIHSLVSLLSKDRWMYAIAAIGILCAFFERKRNKLIISYSAAAMILLLLALYIRQRFVARVYVPLLILSYFQILLHLELHENWKNLIIGFSCMLIALIAFHPLYQLRTTELHETHMIALGSYLEENSDKTFLSESGIVNQLWNNKPIKKLNRQDYPPNILKTGSWDSFSERYYYVTEMNRMDPDSLFYDLAFGENENIYMRIGFSQPTTGC